MKNNNKLFFRQGLIRWNSEMNQRVMPWKGEKDPYKIWLSEIILQQTRVEQGWAYYLRFVKKFPHVQKLAAAADDTVFKLWEGLGYYSRCRNLLATARSIANDLNGIFPSTYDEIVKLKGVGPYTASAIASFAFDIPVAVVDGNVTRVLARYFGILTPVDSTAGKKQFALLAQELLDKTGPGLYNQAIMDFGAVVCKPQLPLCTACVLRENCAAYNTGKVALLPVKEKKIVKKDRWFYYLVVEYKGYYFIRKRETKDIWQDLHEFILVEWEGKVDPGDLLNQEALKSILPLGFHLKEISPEYKQQLTHQTVHGRFIELVKKGGKTPDGYEKIERKRLKQLAFPRMISHFLEAKGWN
ncbi:MAG: A/G-specific adenine glycosylase [Chitinophagaceae bacterium]|nr:MAG: A/G-specific adenine glycosylase [Chitinophagaceae bacterium]